MEPLLRLLPRFDVVLLGPGLGRHLETVAFIGALLQELQEFQGTTVLDADALNGLSLLRDRGFGFHRGQEPAVAADAHQLVLGPRTILTPHGGECARLLATSRQAIEKNLIDSATQLSRTFGTQAVLKSASTVIANPDGQVWINPLGNSGMATAGSGDVLAGLIAGLAAQGASPADASAVGVYLHALAGDVAAELKTPYAMTAGDITACFSEAFARILKSDS
jgi:NAD(P)H-hydrate epimerase